MENSHRNIALTGVPRGGTTLACKLLGAAEDTVALFEPMDVTSLPRDIPVAIGCVTRFFEDSRESLLADRQAWSQQVDGEVPDNPFASVVGTDGTRRRNVALGVIRIEKPLTPRLTLVVKHNAAFTALLPELSQAFETWAIVRNPLAVLASWHSLDLPVSRGRLPAGERLDPELSAALDAESELIARQLRILDWFFTRCTERLPPERILAYERIIATGGGELSRATGLDLPSVQLEERNANPLYDAERCNLLASRLLADDGAWRRCYTEEQVSGLRERMLAREQDR